MKYPTGYLIEREDHARLRATAKPFDRRLYGLAEKARKLPDPRTWQTIEDQSPFPSCVGHALTYCLETLIYMATAREVQLSRWHAYLIAQLYSGTLGQADQGAFVMAAIDAAKERGVCREELLTYPRAYHTAISDAAAADGLTRLLKAHTLPRDYEEGRASVEGLHGPLDVGVDIYESMLDCRGVMELSDLERGEYLGGHSMAVVYMTDRKDRRGRPYGLIPQSWGLKYGLKGFFEVSPDVLEKWIVDPRSEVACLTDVANVDDLPAARESFMESHPFA